MANWRIPTPGMPLAPGQNPFRVKGHGLIARMAVYDRIIPGGSRAVLDAIADPAVRQYLSGPLLAATWYDLFAHAELDLAAARLRSLPAWQSVSTASAAQAEADARGIYKVLLRFVSPHMLVKKLGAISAQYFDHGTVEVERLGDKSARMTRTGIANQLFWWWSGILDGYVTALFKMSGADGVVCTCGALQSDELDNPRAIGHFDVDVRWK
jgi:hypothetical protein